MKSLRLLIPLAAVAVAFSTNARAAVFSFTTDPFAGSTALTTPGRQIVGGEASISFLTGSDVFALDAGAFGVTAINFANNVVGSLPTSGVNTIVLRTFDNDANPATAFGAGNAADLIAGQITTPGPGFFIYFNQGLDLPRLVYSTDLNDNTADLKILFRMTNLNGQGGRDAMAGFTAANFQIIAPAVSEPASVLTLVIAATALVSGGRLLRRTKARD